MINGKTVKSSKVIRRSGSPVGLTLTFTNGEQFTIQSDGVLDFYRADNENARNEWVHEDNMDS